MEFPKGARVKPNARYPQRGKQPSGGVVLSVHRSDPDLRFIKWDNRVENVTVHVKFLMAE